MMDDPDQGLAQCRARPLSEIDLIGSAFEAVSEAFILYDLQGKPLVWNRAYCQLVECSDDEIRERMAWDFHPAEDVEHVARVFSGVLESGEPAYVEAGVLTGTGRVVPCGLSGSPLKNDVGDIIGLCGVGRDLTDLKRAETLYDVIMHSAMEGFTISALDGTFLEVSDSFREMLGHSLSGPGPANVTDIEGGGFPPEIRDRARRIVSGGSDRFEMRLRKKDGSAIDIEISATRRDIDGGRMYSFIRDVTERKRIEAELREHRDNLEGLVQQRTRELEALNARLRREIAVRELAEDELRRVNEELEDYAKLVSHELRTPLSGIFLALEYLERLAGVMSTERLDSEMSSIVESAKQAVSTTERQVDQLLKLARAGQVPEEIEDVEVCAVIQGLLRSMENEFASKSASCEYDGCLGTVRADPLHVQLIFSNLLSNALKYCDDPRPLIEVRLIDRSSKDGNRYLVRDNGSGLPLEFTGEPVESPGLMKAGLGMSIVEKIVKVYGGSVKAFNDDGACIEFVLHDYVR